MTLWAAVLPVLKRAVPAQRLVVLMSRSNRVSRSTERERRIIDLSARLCVVRPGMRPNCLERSLLAYRFLGAAGASPRLVMGVRTVDEGIIGHAWVTIDGEPVHDRPESIAQFVPIVEFLPSGEVVSPRKELRLPRKWR